MVYLLFLVLFLYCSYKIILNQEKIALKYTMLVFVFFTVVMGLRYNVGIDYPNYEAFYYMDSYQYATKEFLWVILNRIPYLLGLDFFVVPMLSILLSNLLIFLALKEYKCKNISLGIILYLSNICLIFLNIIRQGIAVSLLFYGFSFYRKGKYLQYVFFGILAAQFHSSAYLIIFVLPIIDFIIKKIKINFQFVFISIVVCYLLVGLNVIPRLLNTISLYLPLYSKYVDSIFINVSGGSILSLGVMINVVILLLLVYLNKNQKYDTITVLYFIGVLLNILSISSFMIDRIGIYFQIFSILAIPNLVFTSNIVETEKLRKLLVSFIIVIYCGLFVKSSIISAEKLNLDYNHIFSIERLN